MIRKLEPANALTSNFAKLDQFFPRQYLHSVTWSHEFVYDKPLELLSISSEVLNEKYNLIFIVKIPENKRALSAKLT